MTIDNVLARRSSPELLSEAVHRHERLSAEGLRERAFTLAFRSLVYPQIWEDPVVDMEALKIDSTSRVVAIASGGCNVMSYLTMSPAHITAVDLNRAHIALNRLKLAAAKHLPDFDTFYDLFGKADVRDNSARYDTWIAPHLDELSRAYWEGRSMRGRRRIERFTTNFYATGLLGNFIGMGHRIARVLGADPTRLIAAKSMEEQRTIFETELAPLFDYRVVRWLVDRPASLYGLGIPPAQYQALGGGQSMADVLKGRLEKLACGFPIAENYFAQQAFARGYAHAAGCALPPYLVPENFDTVRASAGRVTVRHISMTDFLVTLPHSSMDRYVLLDAQDWMTDADLTRLWTQITRTSRHGARVIFRTAAPESVLPGRIPSDLLQRWKYEADRSAELGARDRSAVYGGFHLYVRED